MAYLIRRRSAHIAIGLYDPARLDVDDNEDEDTED